MKRYLITTIELGGMKNSIFVMQDDLDEFIRPYCTNKIGRAIEFIFEMPQKKIHPISIKQAQAMLGGVSRPTIDQWVKKGMIHKYHIKGVRRVWLDLNECQEAFANAGTYERVK